MAFTTYSVLLKYLWYAVTEIQTLVPVPDVRNLKCLKTELQRVWISDTYCSYNPRNSGK